MDRTLGNLDRCGSALQKAGPTLHRAQEFAEQLNEVQIATHAWRRRIVKMNEATRSFLAEAEARRAPLTQWLRQPAPRPGPPPTYFVAEKGGRVPVRPPLDAASPTERRFTDVGMLTKLETPQVSQADLNWLDFEAILAKRRFTRPSIP